jgi:hypothetical protein
MRKLVLILFWLIVTSAAVQATPIGSYDSYGIWFDRDGVAPAQADNWGMLDGQTYNTGGLYDIEITYHAVSPTKATMFATINGVQQGFITHENAQPDIYPAGLSFESTSLAAMQLFYWSRFPVWKAGDIGLLDISATGNLGTKTYDDLTWSKAGVGPTNYPTVISVGEFADVWDLTAGDVTLSYTVDFRDVWGNATTYATLMFEFGLKPDSEGLVANPVGGGWMGSVQVDLTTSPASWYLNDKHDLQFGGATDESYYDVPEPATIGLLGLGALSLIRRKRGA